MNTGARMLGFLALASLGAACGSRPLDAIELYSASLSHDLVAHWSFDEGQGTVAADESGNNRDAHLTGGTWIADGRFGGAIRFGDGEFATVDPFPDASLGWTVTAWVRLQDFVQVPSTGDVWGTVISTENTGGWEINVDRSEPVPNLHFAFWKGPTQADYRFYTCDCTALGTWSQIVAIVDGGALTFSVYVNGKLVHSEAVEAPIQPGSKTLTMGQWPLQGRYLRGDVDDIAIWRRVLLPAEIALLFEHPVPPPL